MKKKKEKRKKNVKKRKFSVPEDFEDNWTSSKKKKKFFSCVLKEYVEFRKIFSKKKIPVFVFQIIVTFFNQLSKFVIKDFFKKSKKTAESCKSLSILEIVLKNEGPLG